MPVNPDGSNTMSIRAVRKDQYGNLWLAGEGGGLQCFNTRQEQFSRLELPAPIPANLALGGRATYEIDSKGFIWIQDDTRLLRFKPDAQGKPNAFSEWKIDGGSFHEDKKGRYWLVKADGITSFDPQKGEQSTYSLKGITETLDGSFEFTQSGDIYLGGHQGLYYFNPDQTNLNTRPPPVVLTDLKLFNQSVPIRGSYGDTLPRPSPLQQSIRFTKHIELRHDQNDLTIEFAALDFHQSERNQYKYLLEGYTKDTLRTTANRPFATYTNLSPGNYTFRIWGANNDGFWNNEGAVLHISILSPWYWAWWSKTLYLGIILSVLYSIRRVELKKQKQKLAVRQEKLEQERKVNEQLRKVDALKDQFLANTSHELRTPLQGIIGLSESMVDETEKPDHRDNLSMIISSGRRLSNLVNDILDFSKLKSFDIQLLRRPINLRVLGDIVLLNNIPLTKGKDLELINAIPADLLAVNADENRLQQILYNLIGNAIKFTEKGYIKLDAQEKGDLIQVSVEDTGTGIPENKQKAIFQEFEQGDSSISREFTGTGLGLSISKRLVELHGGQMWVRSEVNKGSIFYFTLPLSTEKATTLAASSDVSRIIRPSIKYKETSGTPTPPKGDGDSIRILVVDDEPINQQVFKNQLSGYNFSLSQAMNGEEAIRAIENQEPFDLVLLDVMMPRMSGYEVCQKIREKHLPSELPVIMVTAKNQLQDIVQGLSFGANDYLPKPFHKEELLARIKTQLDLHRIFEVVGRFVPNEFLHSLNRERITEVMLGDYAEREVSVLFLDIRDYTSLAEKMTPEENFKFVNAFHGRMGPIIRKYEGFVNQYLGDAIMAIFTQNPENALQAAIDMQKVLREYNLQRQDQNRQTLKMGVGLHTGPLIMGVIGDQKRMDAATIADTVNTASRIESLTKHYGVSILLSEDCIKQMGSPENFDFRFLGKVQVKGKKEPVGLYECYDGDDEELAARKHKTQADFEKGLKKFFKREFPQAIATFDKVLKINPDDQPARLFMNKSSECLQKGVPGDWTGVEVMTFK